ncbi:metallophosphoesterase family protein [Methylovirgula sp. 4M-Z18]|uniref:metallophosphoesterase family protein n=1 Tax=Methylovirgula sp. 4M-Z18 TaxID=2293567 RepID=UPI000E2E8FF9|nr:metallophosphoesterase family protein [Methylovirgula sp. 4M-Z18]RFB78954.1 metallophosphoesterase [Methylovirgula sp. 4M-Z18]
MRIAVVADIHGNLRALEAVIADIKEMAPDLIVNLGDCVAGPLEPRECADLLMDLKWPTVRGNHDRYMDDMPRQEMLPMDGIARDALDPHHIDWLKNLPLTLDLAPEVLAFHAHPEQDDRLLLERPDATNFLLRHPDEIAQDLGPTAARVLLCGHTHLPRCVALSDGRIVFNPGSVGYQACDLGIPGHAIVQSGSPHARYGVIDRAQRGWTFSHRSVVYDWHAASARARSLGCDDWAYGVLHGTMPRIRGQWS